MNELTMAVTGNKDHNDIHTKIFIHVRKNTKF